MKSTAGYVVVALLAGATGWWIGRQQAAVPTVGPAPSAPAAPAARREASQSSFDPRPLGAQGLRADDGDSLVVRRDGVQHRVRIFCIDAPERDQPAARESLARLAGLVEGRELQLTPIEEDRYGRLIARVSTTGEGDLGRLLIAEGWAWHYDRYCEDPGYAAAASRARAAQLGLWREAHPTPPWDFRQARR